jgi:hypothetical protein
MIVLFCLSGMILGLSIVILWYVFETKARLDMVWKCLRSFLDVMYEIRRQVDEFRKTTEPEAYKKEGENVDRGEHMGGTPQKEGEQ